MNICGVLVHADPRRLVAVESAMRTLPGVKIHTTADGGRFVLTIEDVEGAPALESMVAIHRVPGVVAASLIYHHFEPDQAELSH